MSTAAGAGLGAVWQLARFAAGTATQRERQRERAAALASGADWELLEELLATGRLLPTLGPRLLGLGAPDGFRAAIDAALATQRHQDALLMLIGDRILSELAGAGLRASPLKGPALGEALYGEAGRRQSSDIDLLLAAEDLTAAVGVARGLGYEPPLDPLGADGRPVLHLSMVHGAGELPPVELHWRIHWYETSFARDRLLPPAPSRPGEWSPEPADELAALLLYYARDGFTGLRQATDLGAWWDRFGADLPAGALAGTARAYPRLAPALAAAAAMARRTVGVAPGAAAGLPELGGRGRIATSLAYPPRLYTSREQLFAEIALIDGLLSPRGGLRAYWRRQIAPPRAVLAAQLEKAGVNRATSRLGHAARTLTRFALALSRLPRRRKSSA